MASFTRKPLSASRKMVDENAGFHFELSIGLLFPHFCGDQVKSRQNFFVERHPSSSLTKKRTGCPVLGTLWVALLICEQKSYNFSLSRYTFERWRGADTLLLGGRASFLGFKGFWSAYPNDPKPTVLRREIAALMNPMQKVVISDQITPEDLAHWHNTRIVRWADTYQEIIDCRPQTATGPRYLHVCEPVALERPAGA